MSTRHFRHKYVIGAMTVVLFAALAIGSSAVYAWGPRYASSTTAISGQNFQFHGWATDDVMLDVDGDTNISDECSLYVWDRKAGFASGTWINSTGHTQSGTTQYFPGRAEVMVYRKGEHEGSPFSADDADAWIQSSGNAQVRAMSDGDVVITLGN